MKLYHKPELTRQSKQEVTKRLQTAAEVGNEQARRMLEAIARNEKKHEGMAAKPEGKTPARKLHNR